jgi:hypothetical protein
MRQFPEAGMIKIPDRIHNNRSQELVLMMERIIPINNLTTGMLDKGRRKADETRKFIYPIAQDL